jgi:uncharacterized membrane protein
MDRRERELTELDDFHAAFDQRAREREAARRARRERRRGQRPARHGDQTSLAGSLAGRALIAVVAAMALATAVGLIGLWPQGQKSHGETKGLGPTTTATITQSSTGACPGASGARCSYARIKVHGNASTLDLGPVNTAPSVSAGTTITVSRAPLLRGAAGTAGAEPWEFVDIDRHGSLLLIAIALLLLAILVIRWRGILAAVGVAISLLLIATFLVPGILDGGPPLALALVTAMAVMFVTLVLTNGVGAQTLAAALGIGSTLILTSILAMIAVHIAHINGRTDELSAYLETVNHGISLQGVVIAGMVIGALGVLADTAVTQASAVMALRRTDPTLTPTGLYRAAFHVGRDHLSATIHTLVLAYVGASLPLLLITHATGIGLGDALNTQDIAEPVLATLIGCIGLVCAVPLTTGLASLLIARVPTAALGHGHAHHH